MRLLNRDSGVPLLCTPEVVLTPVPIVCFTGSCQLIERNSISDVHRLNVHTISQLVL
jgi:hypothetical protein